MKQRSLDEILSAMMTENPDMTAGEIKSLFCRRFPECCLAYEQYSRGWLLRVISAMDTARRETRRLQELQS